MNFVLVLLTASLAFAEVKEYTIAPAEENRLELDVDKTGLWKGKRHIFTFAHYNGKLLYDPQNPAAGKVDLTVEAASIQCQDAWVSPKDLKKVLEYAVKDMLAAEKNPEIHFVSTMASAGQVEGMLTIRGISKPVTLTYTAKGLRFEGTAVFKLTDYNLKPPSAALGAIGTKDEMTFRFVVQAIDPQK